MTSCYMDSDCSSAELCAFDPANITHMCTPSQPQKLYEGCLLNTSKISSSIETNDANHTESFQSCLNFSRKQMDMNDLHYTNFVFKPKKHSYVNTSIINVYLKCGEQVIATLPIEDFFEIKCHNNYEQCRLTANPFLYNFTQKNIVNCGDMKNVYLQVEYSCEGEDITKTLKIPLSQDDLKNKKPVEIVLTCPVNPKNTSFTGKCMVTNVNDETSINKTISYENCSNPIFKNPYFVNDVSKYENLRKKEDEKELDEYEKEMKEKKDELNKLKIKKVQKKHKLKNGIEMTEDEAMLEIHNTPRPFEFPTNDWLTFENYDAVEFFIKNSKYTDFVTVYDNRVDTLEEAKNIAYANEKYFFVWFHNNYTNLEYASKLFFISNRDTANTPIDINIFDRNIWVKEQNVTVGVYGGLIEKLSTSGDNTEIGDLQVLKMEGLGDMLKKSLEDTQFIKNEYNNMVTAMEVKRDVNGVVIKNMDTEMTTLQQKIDMNTYEESVNNKIIGIGLFVLFVLVIIFIMVYAWMSSPKK